MTRILKIALVASAVAVCGALGASGSQAAEFRCSVQPCRVTLNPDGTGATAHHVIDVGNTAGENLAFTCKKFSGEGVMGTKTVTAMVLTKLSYAECNANGEPAAVRVNGCQYRITSAEEIKIEGCTKAMEFEVTSTGCVATVGEQGPLKTIKYHIIGAEVNNTTEITMEMKFGFAGTLDGTSKQCLIDTSKGPLTGEYKTGNTLLTGETESVVEMKNLWWA